MSKTLFTGEYWCFHEGRRGMCHRCFEDFQSQLAAEKEKVKLCVVALHSADSGLSALLENEELECRQDEDCDHCFALSSQNDTIKALKKVRVYE